MINLVYDEGGFWKDTYSDLVLFKTLNNKDVCIETGYDNTTLYLEDVEELLTLMKKLNEDISNR